MNTEIYDFIESYNDYIDLHLHLDGSLSIANARNLSKITGIDLPASDIELKSLLSAGPDCRDLNEFLEKFELPCSLLQTKEALKSATFTLLSELSEDGVSYSEIRFAPQLHTLNGMTQKEAVCAVIEGASQAPIPSGIILCFMRGPRSEENDIQNLETLECAKTYLGKGVVALDLAGAEGLFSTSDFAFLFEAAAKSNIPFTIHAGEADGPESIRTAIKFGASRIGHGVRCIEDENLVEYLAQKQIPLELCPTSNLITGIFNDYSQYPLRQLLDKGVLVTINTDDMAVCGTDIKKEYHALAGALKLTEEDVTLLLNNARKAAFN